MMRPFKKQLARFRRPVDPIIQDMKTKLATDSGYPSLVATLGRLITEARRSSVRAVNTVMTATYWEVGRRIVEFEQGGERRAAYGQELLRRLAEDLTERFGRGFSERNLLQMRLFYLGWQIPQNDSAKSLPPIPQNSSAESSGTTLAPTGRPNFALPWSHYVRLLSVKNPEARHFYEVEALRCGWTWPQLDRQIATVFYERTALSKNKVAMMTKGAKARPEDRVTADAEVKDPFMLEFLNLKDEYSEHELEEALLRHLESFLLELGGDFAFVGRQRRLRIGDDWYRVDLLFFHRRLRCLVIIDLKIGKLTHADAGQMHTYLNYARKHWTNEGENPPVGLILCSQPNDALAQYALEGLPNKVLAREYKLMLPQEKQLVAEMEKTRHFLESHRKE
jgi:predicted nuclease of restriction endonuclease-like (RecB) superfamily